MGKEIGDKIPEIPDTDLGIKDYTAKCIGYEPVSATEGRCPVTGDLVNYAGCVKPENCLILKATKVVGKVK